MLSFFAELATFMRRKGFRAKRCLFVQNSCTSKFGRDLADERNFFQVGLDLKTQKKQAEIRLFSWIRCAWPDSARQGGLKFRGDLQLGRPFSQVRFIQPAPLNLYHSRNIAQLAIGWGNAIPIELVHGPSQHVRHALDVETACAVEKEFLLVHKVLANSRPRRKSDSTSAGEAV